MLTFFCRLNEIVPWGGGFGVELRWERRGHYRLVEFRLPVTKRFGSLTAVKSRLDEAFQVRQGRGS